MTMNSTKKHEGKIHQFMNNALIHCNIFIYNNTTFHGSYNRMVRHIMTLIIMSKHGNQIGPMGDQWDIGINTIPYIYIYQSQWHIQIHSISN